MPEKKNVSFEENMKELESIVKKLEESDVTLDEMLKLFEEGIQKTRECTAKLQNAEQKISVLMKNNSGELTEKPFCVE